MSNLPKYNRFSRGSGVFVCEGCGKKTRETDSENAGLRLCSSCLNDAYAYNRHSDKDHEHNPDPKCKYCRKEGLLNKSLSNRIDSFINKARTPEDILRVGSATPEQKEKLGKIDAVRAKYKRPWRTNIHPNSYQTAEERKEKYHLARELGANRNQAVGLRDNHYGIMALHLAKQIDDFIQKQEMSERLKQLLEQTRRDWEKLKTANPEERAKILGKKKLKPYVKYGGKLIPREEAERRRNRVYDKYDPVTGNRTHEKIIKPVLKQAIEDFRKALKFESEKEFEDWQTKLPKEEQIKEPEKIERPKADVETPSYPSPKRKKGADVISEVGRQLSPKGPGYHSPEDITEDIRESQRLARKITGQNGD